MSSILKKYIEEYGNINFMQFFEEIDVRNTKYCDTWDKPISCINYIGIINRIAIMRIENPEFEEDGLPDISQARGNLIFLSDCDYPFMITDFYEIGDTYIINSIYINTSEKMQLRCLLQICDFTKLDNYKYSLMIKEQAKEIAFHLTDVPNVEREIALCIFFSIIKMLRILFHNSSEYTKLEKAIKSEFEHIEKFGATPEHPTNYALMDSYDEMAKNLRERMTI